jgi:hypothetical protein
MPAFKTEVSPGAHQTNDVDGLHDESHWVPIYEQPLFTPKKLRMVCIGAGYSGLMLAYKIKWELKLDNFLDLAIYEKNHGIGGTWLENVYPGVAWLVL